MGWRVQMTIFTHFHTVGILQFYHGVVYKKQRRKNKNKNWKTLSVDSFPPPTSRYLFHSTPWVLTSGLSPPPQHQQPPANTATTNHHHPPSPRNMTVADIECPICFDIFVDPVTNTCGHTLCKTWYSIEPPLLWFCGWLNRTLVIWVNFGFSAESFLSPFFHFHNLPHVPSIHYLYSTFCLPSPRLDWVYTTLAYLPIGQSMHTKRKVQMDGHLQSYLLMEPYTFLHYLFSIFLLKTFDKTTNNEKVVLYINIQNPTHTVGK